MAVHDFLHGKNKPAVRGSIRPGSFVDAGAEDFTHGRIRALCRLHFGSRRTRDITPRSTFTIWMFRNKSVSNLPNCKQRKQSRRDFVKLNVG